MAQGRTNSERQIEHRKSALCLFVVSCCLVIWFVRLPTSLVRASQVHMMASVHKGLKREPSEPEDGQPERVSDPGSLGRFAGGVDSNEPPESERVQHSTPGLQNKVMAARSSPRPRVKDNGATSSTTIAMPSILSRGSPTAKVRLDTSTPSN